MTYAWFDCGDGRKVYRKVPEPVKTRSHLPAPYCISDCIEPVQSMADGKWYSSKTAIRETYKPSGNPQGVQYTEIGSDPAWKRMDRPQPKPDTEGVKQAIEKAVARVNRGETVQP